MTLIADRINSFFVVAVVNNEIIKIYRLWKQSTHHQMYTANVNAVHCSIVDWFFSLRDCHSIMIRFIKVVSHTHSCRINTSFGPPPLSHSFRVFTNWYIFRVSLSIYQIDCANDGFLLLSFVLCCRCSLLLINVFLLLSLENIACESLNGF